MLSEAKMALRITSDAYDLEIASLLDAGAKDLASVGIVLPGTVAFTVSNGAVTDASTLTDSYVIRALITYVRVHFGSPPDYDKVLESYDAQKKKLANTDAYTYWGGDGCSEQM